MIDPVLEMKDCVIKGLDPRIRIVSALIISLGAALCNSLWAASAYLGVALAVIGMAGLNGMMVFNRLKPLFLFLVMIWIFLPLTFAGQEVWRMGVISISREGIAVSAMITLKSAAILMVFTGLLATLPMAALGAGLHRLHVPDKLIFLFLMSYRYIFVIEDEYRRLLRAARFRGFVPRTSLHSYKTFAYLAGMLFVRASFRARRVYNAMLCRGFNGRFHSLDQVPTNGLNSAFLVGTVLCCSGLFIAEFVV